MTYVIMPDNTIANAVDVMQEIIESTVQDVIESSEGLDLTSAEGIKDVGEQIAYYIEISTGEKVDVHAVIAELKQWL